jgi:hypothetical protein
VGALAGALLTRSRLAGAVLLAGVAGSFIAVTAYNPGVIHDATEAEDLVGLVVGLMVERHWERARAQSTGEPGSTDAAALAT